MACGQDHQAPLLTETGVQGEERDTALGADLGSYPLYSYAVF